MRILAFAASLRRGSHNRRLLTLAVEVATRAGAEVDVAAFAEFDMPLYNHDVQEETGFPAGAQELARRISAADGLMIASPEYNNSMPGTLKNAIDWVSRMRPVPLRGKSAMLLSTSTGLVGGNRGLWSLRVPLEVCGVSVYPDMFSLAQGQAAIDDAGRLKEPAAVERLEKMVTGYVAQARKLAGP